LKYWWRVIANTFSEQQPRYHTSQTVSLLTSIKNILTQTKKNEHNKIIIYGGNGFVGTRVAKQLAERKHCTVCLSRTGYKPLHLNDQPWSEAVRWCKGDANTPDLKLLESAHVLICLVGSPPLPTFSKESFENQVLMNGITNVNAIQAAAQAGVKRLVLLGAKIPWPLDTDRFGYAKGKRLSLEAAKDFAQLSDEHTAVVLKPGAIFGKRHLRNGKVVPLDWMMAPMTKILPWYFNSVDAVAARIVEAALNDTPYLGNYTIIESRAI